jgi:hypothetical protein
MITRKRPAAWPAGFTDDMNYARLIRPIVGWGMKTMKKLILAAGLVAITTAAQAQGYGYGSYDLRAFAAESAAWAAELDITAKNTAN